jgi:electron transfer flavoprotein alpha subunit
LNHGSLGAITAAQKLGGSITGFVAGSNIKAVAEEAAKVNGIEKIIAVDNAAYDKVRWFDFRRLMDIKFICRDYPKTTLHCWWKI